MNNKAKAIIGCLGLRSIITTFENIYFMAMTLHIYFDALKMTISKLIIDL